MEADVARTGPSREPSQKNGQDVLITPERKIIMPTKLKLKMGSLEIEYEGEEEFLKNELPDLLGTVRELGDLTEWRENGTSSGNAKSLGGDRANHLSTSVIASKLNCKQGADLIEAAAFYLIGNLKKETFTRDELIREMRSAKAFFKKSYVNNLSNYLKQLVSGQRLNEVGTDVFSVPHDVLKQMKDRFGI
jgi:hypothetical protein